MVGRKKCLVPEVGIEPTHPCECCDLNTVRLPISSSEHSAILQGNN